MVTSPKLGIQLLDVAQAQKEVTVNEAFLRLESLLHGVISKGDNTPPANPADGDSYLLGDTPTGAWAGKALHLAFYVDGNGWRFVAPKEGMAVWVAADDNRAIYHDGAWQAVLEVAPTEAPSGATQNLLLNGHFPIWQRGTSFTPNNNAYTADRWRVLSAANGAVSISKEQTTLPAKESTAAKLTVQTANQKFGVWQVIEGVQCQHARGESVTLSVQLRVSNAALEHMRIAIVEFTGTVDDVATSPVAAWNAQGTLPTLASNYAYVASSTSLAVATSDYTQFSVTGAVGSGISNLGVLIWSDSTSNSAAQEVYLTQVQLELGSTANDYTRLHYPEEFRLCQRYYSHAYQTLPGYAISPSQIFQRVYCPQEMRTAPAVSVVGVITVSDDFTNIYTQSSSGYGSNSITTQSARLFLEHFSGLTGGKMYSGSGSTTNYVVFEAEL